VSQVTIVGLGLIGGSIAKGLAARNLKGLEIHGYDRDFAIARNAEKLGVIATGHRDLQSAVANASLVVIATPVTGIAEVLDEIAPHVRAEAIVTDTGSSKGEVHRWAARALPESISFIGGHPMAGREEQGFANSSPTLFEGAAWCICPTPSADEQSINTVLGMIALLGGNPIFIDPDEHDQYVAAISHIPLLLATSLFNMCRRSIAWEDMSLLAASGFKDATRLASGDALMARDIFLTNPEGVSHWIDRIIEELRGAKELLGKSPEEIFNYFAEAKVERDIFIQTAPTRRAQRVIEDMPSGREEVMRMFMGTWMMEKAKELPQQMRSKPQDEDLREKLGLNREGVEKKG
jgi:prephenate dehydrogenase